MKNAVNSQDLHLSQERMSLLFCLSLRRIRRNQYVPWQLIVTKVSKRNHIRCIIVLEIMPVISFNFAIGNKKKIYLMTCQAQYDGYLLE